MVSYKMRGGGGGGNGGDEKRKRRRKRSFVCGGDLFEVDFGKNVVVVK